MSRRWLVVVSGVAHLSIAGGLWVSGIWHIDRLEAPRLYLRGLAVMMPPPAPSGGPVAPDPPEIKRKPPRKKPTQTVQPEPTTRHDEPPVDRIGDGGPGEGPGPGDPTDTGTCHENCGETRAAVPVCGDGSVDPGEQCDDGNTVNGDGCSSTCRTEVKPTRPPIVAPTVLQGLRISGETQIHPSAATQNIMMRANAPSARGVVLVCIAADGSVASAAMQRSTSYADYDATLLSAVHAWRYRPYLLNGAPVPACSTVTFLYTIR